jgi:hypothetical protein
MHIHKDIHIQTNTHIIGYYLFEITYITDQNRIKTQ